MPGERSKRRRSWENHGNLAQTLQTAARSRGRAERFLFPLCFPSAFPSISRNPDTVYSPFFHRGCLTAEASNTATLRNGCDTRRIVSRIVPGTFHAPKAVQDAKNRCEPRRNEFSFAFPSISRNTDTVYPPFFRRGCLTTETMLRNGWATRRETRGGSFRGLFRGSVRGSFQERSTRRRRCRMQRSVRTEEKRFARKSFGYCRPLTRTFLGPVSLSTAISDRFFRSAPREERRGSAVSSFLRRRERRENRRRLANNARSRLVFLAR